MMVMVELESRFHQLTQGEDRKVLFRPQSACAFRGACVDHPCMSEYIFYYGHYDLYLILERRTP